MGFSFGNTPLAKIADDLFGLGDKPDYSGLIAAQHRAAEIYQDFTDDAVKQLADFSGIVYEQGSDWRKIKSSISDLVYEDIKDGSYNLEAWEGNYSAEDLERDPGYAFRLSESNKVLERAANARGLNKSGALLEGIDQNTQNVASQEFGRARQRALDDLNTRNNIRQTNRDNRLGLLTTASNFDNANLQQRGAILGTQIAYQDANAQAQGNAGIGAANAGIFGQQAESAQKQQNFNNLFKVAEIGLAAYTGGASVPFTQGFQAATGSNTSGFNEPLA